jgi:hypothetical protein
LLHLAVDDRGRIDGHADGVVAHAVDDATAGLQHQGGSGSLCPCAEAGLDEVGDWPVVLDEVERLEHHRVVGASEAHTLGVVACVG